MNISSLLVLASQVALALLGIASIIKYLRKRDKIRLDIALMLMSIALPLFIEIFGRIVNFPDDMVTIIGSIAMLSHPYLLLRLINNFDLVPRWMLFGAVFALVVSSLSIIAYVALSTPLIAFVVVLAVFFESSAIIVLLRGASTTAGVIRERLTLTALGSLFLCVMAFAISIPFVEPTLLDYGKLVRSICGFGTVFFYWIAFLTPPHVRHLWQSREVYNFLVETHDTDTDVESTILYELLCQYAVRIADKCQAMVYQWHNNQMQLRALTDKSRTVPAIIDLSTSPIRTTLQAGIAQIIHRQETLDPALIEMFTHFQAETTFAIPMPTTNPSATLLLVFLHKSSLFPEDDLETLSTLAHHVEQMLAKHDHRQQVMTQEIQDKTAYSRLLRDVAIMTNRTDDTQTALAYTLEQICTVCDVQVGHIVVRAEQVMSGSVWHYDDPQRFDGVRNAIEALDSDPASIPVEHNLDTSHLADDQTQIHAHTLALRNSGILSAFTFPILVQDKVTGVIELFFTSVVELSQDMREMMHQMSNLLGRVIEREQAQAKLQQSEEHFRITFEYSAVGMVHTDNQGIILRVNAKFCEIIGYTANELLGRNWREFTLEDDRGLDWKQNHLLLENEIDTYSIEKRYIHKNGHIVWVKLTIADIHQRANRDIFALIIVEDITQRIQVRQALQDSEARYAGILKTAVDAIISIDETHQIVQFNRGAELMFGYSSDQMMGQSMSKLMPHRVLKQQQELIEDFIKGLIPLDTTEHRIEMICLTRDQHEVLTEATFSKIALTDQSLITIILRDITQRKEFERNLEEDRNLLRTVIDNVPVSIYVKDIEGRFLVANDYLAKLMSQPRSQDLLGKTDFDFFQPDLAQQFFEDEQQLINSGKPIIEKDELIPVDDNVLHIVTTKLPLYSADGNIKSILGINYDITDRIQTLEALQLSETRFSTIFHKSPIPTVISQLEDAVAVDVNDAFLKLMELDYSEYAGKALTDLPISIDLNQRNQLRGELIRDGQISNREIQITMGSGKTLYLIVYATVIKLYDVDHVITIFYNITDKRAIETSLQLSEQRFRTLIESAPDAMVIVNQHGEIVLVNSQTEELFGYQREELLGQSIDELVPTAFSNRHATHREQFVDDPHTRQMGIGLELYALRKDGSQFPVEISLSPISTPQETLIASSIRDITERMEFIEQIKRMNQELEQRVADRTARLEAINQELEAFTYSISHDLRAPLRAISMYSSYVQTDIGDDLSDKAHHYIERIHTNAQTMNQLIDTLLNLSKLDRQKLNRRHVITQNIVQHALEYVLAEHTALPPIITIGILPPCNADPILLRQVFINLLSNAVKFSQKVDTPHVEVGCELTNNSEIVFFVRDNGIGFNMKYADQLFGVFQRLHDAEEFEGHGAGLSIVQRIVERHGGTVWVEAEVNQGATFYFTLERGDDAIPSEASLNI